MIDRDPTATEAWARGVMRAKEALALQPESRQPVPESRRGLAVSIAASPRLLDWPEEVREWIFRRCTMPARGQSESDRPIFSREFLGLRTEVHQ